MTNEKKEERLIERDDRKWIYERVLTIATYAFDGRITQPPMTVAAAN
jgi:hypothetical protein